MDTSDILTLIGLGFTGLVCLLGTVTWFHLFMADYKEKARAELAEAIKTVKEETAKEVERVENQVKDLTSLAMSVALMGKAIEHLTENFKEHQGSLIDVKKALTSIDNRINQMALDAAKRAPRATRPRTRKDKINESIRTSD